MYEGIYHSVIYSGKILRLDLCSKVEMLLV